MSEKKIEAISLRNRGFSIRDIELKLSVPRSTLSYWFKTVELTNKQKANLKRRWELGLIKARTIAADWHREEKKKRLKEAHDSAEKIIKDLNFKDRSIIELALAMLYLGEGAKSSDDTAMGNSDPLILNVFVSILINFYKVNPEKIKCSLYLRADQKSEEMKKFWSKSLNLPIQNFVYVNLDKRTSGSKTFDSYRGVCMVRCGNVAIKRKLLYISRGFCEEILKICRRV